MGMERCPACAGTGKRLIGASPTSGLARFALCDWCQGFGNVPAEVTNKYKDTLKGVKAMGEAKPKVKPTTVSGALKKVGKKAGKELASAAGRKVAAGATNQLFEATKSRLGDKFPLLFHTPLGEKAVKFGVPLALMLGCEMAANYEGGEAILPAKLLSAVSTSSEAALAGISDEAVEELVEHVMPFLLEVAAISLGAGGAAAVLESGPEIQVEVEEDDD